MPEFTNTCEENCNALITTIALFELSFTSGTGSSCVKSCAHECYVRSPKSFTLLNTRGRCFAAVGYYSKQSLPHDSNKTEREGRDINKDTAFLLRGNAVLNLLM